MASVTFDVWKRLLAEIASVTFDVCKRLFNPQFGASWRGAVARLDLSELQAVQIMVQIHCEGAQGRGFVLCTIGVPTVCTMLKHTCPFKILRLAFTIGSHVFY